MLVVGSSLAFLRVTPAPHRLSVCCASLLLPHLLVCPCCVAFAGCHVPKMHARRLASAANHQRTGLDMATTCCFAAAAPCASCKQGAADNVTILVLQSVLRGLRRLHCQVFGLDLFDLCQILHHPRHSARRPCICRVRLARRLVVMCRVHAALPCSWRGAGAAIMQASSLDVSMHL